MNISFEVFAYLEYHSKLYGETPVKGKTFHCAQHPFVEEKGSVPSKKLCCRIVKTSEKDN